MHQTVVIGCSAGGLNVLIAILGGLPVDYPIPIIVVQHRANEQTQLLEEILQHKCVIQIKQADEKEAIEPGVVYIAPPGYHLLIEANRTFSLASDLYVQHSMPSINVTFESAAYAYRNRLIGIIMTGASKDGADGISRIKEFDGVTIAQDPLEAEYSAMPSAAIATGKIDHVLKIAAIKRFLQDLPVSRKI